MKDYNRVGEKHTTNEGYPITIFEYFDAHNCSIVFECGFKLYNIQIVCDKYNIPLFTDIDELLNTIKL